MVIPVGDSNEFEIWNNVYTTSHKGLFKTIASRMIQRSSIPKGNVTAVYLHNNYDSDIIIIGDSNGNLHLWSRDYYSSGPY